MSKVNKGETEVVKNQIIIASLILGVCAVIAAAMLSSRSEDGVSTSKSGKTASETGRYQYCVDKAGNVVIFDTATGSRYGEGWVQKLGALNAAETR